MQEHYENSTIGVNDAGGLTGNARKASIQKAVLKRSDFPVFNNTNTMVNYAINNWDKPSLSKYESFYVIFLDRNQKGIKWQLFAMGTIDECEINVRKLVKDALLNDADAMVLFHNHPSSKTSPSEADLKTTELIYRACQAVGIKLIDHIIVSDTNESYSFREDGLINRYYKDFERVEDFLTPGTLENISLQIIKRFCSTARNDGNTVKKSLLDLVNADLTKLFIKFYDPII